MGARCIDYVNEAGSQLSLGSAELGHFFPQHPEDQSGFMSAERPSSWAELRPPWI